MLLGFCELVCLVSGFATTLMGFGLLLGFVCLGTGRLCYWFAVLRYLFCFRVFGGIVAFGLSLVWFALDAIGCYL